MYLPTGTQPSRLVDPREANIQGAREVSEDGAAMPGSLVRTQGLVHGLVII